MATYTVRSGDNLSAIARREGLDVRDLIAANPGIENVHLIRPGDTIEIPSGPVSRSARQSAGNRLTADLFQEETQQLPFAGGALSQFGFTPDVQQRLTPELDAQNLQRANAAFPGVQGLPSNVNDLVSQQVRRMLSDVAQRDAAQQALGSAPDFTRTGGGRYTDAAQLAATRQAQGFGPDFEHREGGRFAGGTPSAAPEQPSVSALARRLSLGLDPGRVVGEAEFSASQTALIQRLMSQGVPREVAEQQARQQGRLSPSERAGVAFRALQNNPLAQLAGALRQGLSVSDRQFYEQAARSRGQALGLYGRALNDYVEEQTQRALQTGDASAILGRDIAEAAAGTDEQFYRKLFIDEGQRLGLYGTALEQYVQTKMEGALGGGGGAPAGTAEWIEQRQRELAGQTDNTGMRTATVGATGYPIIQSPDVMVMQQENWERNIARAAISLLADDIEPYEHVQVYADAMQFIADLVNGDEQAEVILAQMTPNQLNAFTQFFSENPDLVMSYVNAVDGKSRQEILELATQELRDLGYIQMSGGSVYKAIDDQNDTAGAIEDLVFGSGGGAGVFRQGGGGTRGGGGGSGGRGGGGRGSRASDVFSTGASLFNWRITA